MLEHRVVGQDVHIHPAGACKRQHRVQCLLELGSLNWTLTWLDCGQNSSVGREHSVVNVLLALSELPVGGEGASDVRGIAVVFRSHVVQA